MFEHWSELDERNTGMVPAALARPNELLRTAERAMAGQGYLEWARYMAAAELHRQIVDPAIDASDLFLDAYASCAARLAAAQHLSQIAAENHLACALALRDRLPQVAEMLKEGFVAPHHIPTIVSRTDLIEGSDHTEAIDRDIADQLRRRGSWSRNRLRDMVDSTIFRRDPDLVREDRSAAKDKRGVWAEGHQNGMSELTAVLTTENSAMIMQRLEKLAASVCKRDTRTKPQRMSDALFAITMAREFTCECGDDPEHPCTADIITVPADGMFSGIDAKIVLHAIANQSTLRGEDDEPGYLEGRGVVSADHARDLADQAQTTTRPLGNTETGYVAAPRPELSAKPEPTESSSARSNTNSRANYAPPQPSRAERRAMKGIKQHPATPPDQPQLDLPIEAEAKAGDHEPVFQWPPLPTVQPGDHYRPSAVLDTYLRIRDLYCTWPGCDRPAWSADLDHTQEYNHNDPASGGHTHPEGMKALCRFHHLLKTHTAWLDDQYVDAHGRTRTTITTPEGRTYHGPSWTGDDLFTGLRLIVWDHSPPNRRRVRADSPIRTMSRTRAKHTRRHQERMRNRRTREPG